jgi:hypothetical protein
MICCAVQAVVGWSVSFVRWARRRTLFPEKMSLPGFDVIWCAFRGLPGGSLAFVSLDLLKAGSEGPTFISGTAWRAPKEAHAFFLTQDILHFPARVLAILTARNGSPSATLIPPCTSQAVRRFVSFVRSWWVGGRFRGLAITDRASPERRQSNQDDGLSTNTRGCAPRP